MKQEIVLDGMTVLCGANACDLHKTSHTPNLPLLHGGSKLGYHSIVLYMTPNHETLGKVT